MQTARFITRLENNIEVFYQTETNPQTILRNVNLTTLSNHTKEGSGTYFDTFIDDMTVSRTVVTTDVTDEGRLFYNLDVQIVKLDAEDKQLMLNLFLDRYREQLIENQNSELKHPLPEVKICP